MKLRHLSLVYEQQNPESSMWILGYQVPVCSFGVCWYPQLHQKENIQRNFAARGCFSLNKKNMFCWKLLSLWGGVKFSCDLLEDDFLEQLSALWIHFKKGTSPKNQVQAIFILR